MRLENFIHAKKLTFIRTVAVLEESSIYLEVFKSRMHQFNDNITSHCVNEHQSPIMENNGLEERLELFHQTIQK